jgi:prepilin-type N-terminal cleavage/methylation domain-containing protein
MRSQFLYIKKLFEQRGQKGFTILELLAVAAMIGLLAAIIFIIFNDHKIAARNSVREGGLAGLRSVLENAYKANGVYPIETKWCLAGIADSGDGYYCQNLFSLTKDMPMGKGLDPSFPKNFKDGCRYGYYYKSSIDGKSYELAAKMEKYSSMIEGKEFFYISSASSEGSKIVSVSDVGDLCGYGSTGVSSGQTVGGTSLFANYPSAQSGYSDPVGFIYATPFFSLINEQGGSASVVQIQLRENGQSDLIWDSGDIPIAPTASGQRTPDIFYGSGNPPSKILEAGKSYKWRARIKTSDYSDWSSEAAISMTASGEMMIARFYSGPGTGYVGLAASSWARARNPSKGTGSIFSNSQFRVGTGYDGAYSVERGFAPVDTSGIPDDAMITSAIFVFSGSGNAGGAVCGWNGSNKANIVLSSQADPLSLSAGDFGKCGETDEPELGSDAGIPFSSGVGSNYALTLNDIGRSWISKTGWTLLGLRSANDIANQGCSKFYTNTVHSNSFKAAENKPYLEIAYAVEGGVGRDIPSLSPSFLFANYPSAQFGVQDQSSFAFSTPFFSFVANRSGQAEADIVNIQLAEYIYSDPVWDSGDISIAPTASGQRTPDIFYGSGNPPSKILEAGKSYKWRARIKTNSDPEEYSPWSSDAFISMSGGVLTARFYSAGGDGTAEKSAGPASQANWQAAHDSEDPIASSSAAQGLIGTVYSNETTTISRGFFLFDSSKLPDNASIAGGSLIVWVNGKENKGDNGKNWLAVVQSFQEDIGSLAPKDYQNCGSDDGTAGRAKYASIQEGSGRVAIADIPENTDHITDRHISWALNKDGIGWISKTGLTKLGLREGNDVLNSRNRNYLPSANINCNFSEGDDGKDPYLEVNYR